MPILKQCSFHGCRTILDSSIKYCPYHQKVFEKQERKRYKRFDQKRSDDHIHAFYKTKEWNQLKAVVMARTNGLDLFSLYMLNIVEPADLYHHIEPVADCWGRRLDVSNIVGLTYGNHQHIHTLYSASDKDRRHTQRLLWRLLERYVAGDLPFDVAFEKSNNHSVLG